MQPLRIQAKCVADADQRLDHIKYALSLELEEIGRSDPHEKACVLVGSGPSVETQIEVIRELQADGCFILAVKGGHDFLIEHGIIPHAAVCVDPMDDQMKYFQKKFDGDNAPIYFIASQCHKAMFDYLEDQRVVLWHMMCSSAKEVLKGRTMVGGGSTSGSRAIVLAHLMGFRKFHLFGYDSCLVDGLRKIDGERWGDTEEEPILELFAAGETFYADPAMAAQANEIQEIIECLEGSHFKAHGKGLIQTIFANNAVNNIGGYYAVGDEFGGNPVPRLRTAAIKRAQRMAEAGDLGIYRGPGYFPRSDDQVAA